MTIKILDPTEPIEYPNTCQYSHCQSPPAAIAYDREFHTIQFYCQEHVKLVLEKGNPEYVEGCPNCGCGFPVN